VPRQEYFNRFSGIRYTGCRLDVAGGRIIAIHVPESEAHRKQFTALCSGIEASNTPDLSGRRAWWRESSLRNNRGNGGDYRGR
jgi:hypothetical protein